jgi:hypothetical protein
MVIGIVLVPTVPPLATTWMFTVPVAAAGAIYTNWVIVEDAEPAAIVRFDG